MNSLLEELDDQGEAIHALAEARFLALQGNVEKAESSFRRALEADPSSGAPNFWLGRFLLIQERDDEAIAQLQRAADINSAYEYLGLLQDFSQARKCKKNWDGLATIMTEMVRRQPNVIEDRRFAKLYSKACKKRERAIEMGNPYAQA